MGELSMRPDELHGGATAFGQHAETLRGHAQQVNDLMSALAPAFEGVGMAVWPSVQARLADLASRCDAAHARTTNAGDMLRAAATGATALDQQGGTAIRR